MLPQSSRVSRLSIDYVFQSLLAVHHGNTLDNTLDPQTERRRLDQWHARDGQSMSLFIPTQCICLVSRQRFVA